MAGLVAGPVAGKVLPKSVGQTKGLNVTVLSILLTIIGTWAGTKQTSLAPFQNFLHIWPGNFGVAFWIELLVARPIARFAMKELHARQDRKPEEVNS